MYIKSIKLQNYRNYEHLDLDLGKKATLLIGKNGAGKTNMISALKQSLSFIFSKNSKITQRNFVANTLSSIKSFETTDSMRKRNDDGTQMQEGTWPIKITTTIDLGCTEPLKVVFERESVSFGMKESYSNSSIKFWDRYSDLKDLPVLVFFSDSYPHERPTIGKKIQELLDSEFGISQSAGYYNWDDPRDCSSVWLQFFAQQWKNYKYGHNNNYEKEYISSIRDCLITFSRSLKNADENPDFEVKDITVVARGKKEVTVLLFNNGMTSDFESLPAGYRRVFSMAFDIANRSFLLNKDCNPEGVAFIDEIDLHLHPSIAQEIVERMQNTFPRMQFVMSTHSPLVLSNFLPDVENHIVYSLSRSVDFSTDVHKVDYFYGIDYNNLLIDLMGTRIRNTKLRQLIDSYMYWKDAKDVELMESTFKEIIDLVGKDSHVVKELIK